MGLRMGVAKYTQRLPTAMKNCIKPWYACVGVCTSETIWSCLCVCSSDRGDSTSVGCGGGGLGAGGRTDGHHYLPVCSLLPGAWKVKGRNVLPLLVLGLFYSTHFDMNV